MVNYVEENVTKADRAVSNLAFGFFLGFGYFGVLHCYQQTHRLSVYIVLCWIEIVVSSVLAILVWLYFLGTIDHSFSFFFFVCLCWALEVLVLLQIIVNRICLLQQVFLRAIFTVGTLSIAAAVFAIWIPARMQISPDYVRINNYWDRTEKIMYLLIDGFLNFFFMYTVRKNLSPKNLSPGIAKYDNLIRFNRTSVFVSLSMDALIIGTMSLPNSFTYMQIHPVGYIIKLNIEMAMSQLIVSVASDKPFRGSKERAGDDKDLEIQVEAMGMRPVRHPLDRTKSKDDDAGIAGMNGMTRFGGVTIHKQTVVVEDIIIGDAGVNGGVNLEDREYDEDGNPLFRSGSPSGAAAGQQNKGLEAWKIKARKRKPKIRARTDVEDTVDDGNFDADVWDDRTHHVKYEEKDDDSLENQEHSFWKTDMTETLPASTPSDRTPFERDTSTLSRPSFGTLQESEHSHNDTVVSP